MLRTLVKSGSIVFLLSLSARVLGLYREVVIAQLLGAGVETDLFVFADRVPRLLYGILVEGIFAQALMPVLVEYACNKDRRGLDHFIAISLGAILVSLTVFCCLGIIFSPVVTAVVCPGWFIQACRDPGQRTKYWLAVGLLIRSFPFLYCMVLAGFAGCILNLNRYFFSTACVPIVVNITLIGTAWCMGPGTVQPVTRLILGMVGGGLLGLIFQLGMLKGAGHFVWPPHWQWAHPGLLQVRRLVVPVILGAGIMHLNKYFSTLICSFLATGVLSWLHYAQRVADLSTGMLSVVMSTILLPALAKVFQRQTPGEAGTAFSDTLEWGLRLTLLFGIPACISLSVLGYPLLTLLFFRGCFGIQALEKTQWALQAYNLGGLSVAVSAIFTLAYYARQDTETPLRFAILAGIVDASVNLCAFAFGYLAVAAAYPIAQTLKAVLLYRQLRKDKLFRISRDLLRFIACVMLAALAMFGMMRYRLPDNGWWLGVSWYTGAWTLARFLGLGMVTYGICLWGLGATSWGQRRDTYGSRL